MRKKLIYCLLILFTASSLVNSNWTVKADGAPQASLTVQSISAGTYHMLALMSDGTVMSWGRNTSGQLGVGVTGNRDYASPVIDGNGQVLSDVVAVSAASQHSLALKRDGTVYSWGDNGMGQLGRIGATRVAGKIDGFNNKKITEISTSDSHSLALDEDGGVWSWGLNIYGQLGNGTKTSATFPVQSLASSSIKLYGIKAIAAGQFHSLALTTTNEVLAWGMNTNGQLGNGTQSSQVYPVNVIDGVNSGNLTGVKMISAKGYSSLALKTDGILWSWGDNLSGQLGRRDYPIETSARPIILPGGIPFGDVKMMEAGFQHSVAVRNDGTLWTWGSNQNVAATFQYQLGREWNEPSVAIPGQVIASEDGTPVVEAAIAVTGNAHTSILGTDGSVWSVGGNSSKALGGNRTEATIQKLAQMTLGTLAQTKWTADSARSATAGDTVQVSIQLADSAGNALNTGTDRVRMTTDFGVVGPVSYAGAGKFTASFRSERPGISKVTATINGLEVPTKLSVQVTPGAPSASASTLIATPSVVTADGTSSSILTLELKDAWGNAMSSSVPNVSLTASRGTLGPLTELSVGKYEAALTSTVADASTVSVAINEVPLGLDARVTFLSSDPDAANSVLHVEPNSLPANGENKATIVLQVYDKFGNALTQSGGDVSFLTDLGEIGSVTEAVYGVYAAEMTSRTSGKATVTAMRTGLMLGQPAEVNFVPVVTKVVFGKNQYEAMSGTSVATALTAHYWNGETKDVTKESTYSVSDSSIATINSDGLVYGQASGQITLTARFGGSETTVPVVITRRPSGGDGPGTTPGTNPGTGPGTNPNPPVKPDPSGSDPKSGNPDTKPDPGLPGAGTKQPVTYAEVSGHWAEASINKALTDGWARGYADNSFRPDQAVTRAEFVKLLINAFGYKDTGEDTEISFKDGKEIRAWARPSVTLAVKHKLISGYGDGSFQPNALLTRTEMTAIIIRALGLTLATDATTKFADDGKIPSWAKPFVAVASELGIIQGRKADLFVPKGTATRAEAIVFIGRALSARKQ
ncbi:RCC1 domain-containing protein [Cohnella herbarum]|uniref:SLH domain-containing protein n=1 Tax=Cohnella herbarum TaxID=2728023 RepID=A0A7Z2VLG9_9BACL|nr:invasin domain 3-containing protein [Cohnella herbarum]QJD84990.1 hypothetical protein HH215_18585 [Cohnella herbarum]